MTSKKTIIIDSKEHYLFGKDRRVVDIEAHHPTVSKQHAVIQYRLVKGNRIM